MDFFRELSTDVRSERSCCNMVFEKKPPRATFRNVPVPQANDDEDSEMEEDIPETPRTQSEIIAGFKSQVVTLWKKIQEKDDEISLLKTRLIEAERKTQPPRLAKTTNPTTTPMTLADEGFTLVQPKRKKEATASSMLAALCGPSAGPSKKAKTAAAPQPSTTTTKVTRTSPPPTASNQAPMSPGPATAPPAVAPAEKNPPPIVVSPEVDWLETTEALQSSGIHFKSARQCADGVRVHPTTPDDFRRMVTLLRQRGAAFHTYQLEEEKTLKVVIRGVPTSVKEEAARRSLQEQGFPIKAVARMKGRYGRPYPMLFVQLEKSVAGRAIFQLTKLLHLDVKVEHKRKEAAATQCHRCQGIGHGQSRCERRPVCVKCAGPHSSPNCPVPREDAPTCANCNQPHPANYRGCLSFRQARRPARTQTRTTYAEVAAERKKRDAPKDHSRDVAAVGKVIAELIKAVESASSPAQIAAAVWTHVESIQRAA